MIEVRSCRQTGSIWAIPERLSNCRYRRKTRPGAVIGTDVLVGLSVATFTTLTTTWADPLEARRLCKWLGLAWGAPSFRASGSGPPLVGRRPGNEAKDTQLARPFLQQSTITKAGAKICSIHGRRGRDASHPPLLCIEGQTPRLRGNKLPLRQYSHDNGDPTVAGIQVGG